jgi:hypothetical protein
LTASSRFTGPRHLDAAAGGGPIELGPLPSSRTPAAHASISFDWADSEKLKGAIRGPFESKEQAIERTFEMWQVMSEEKGVLREYFGRGK